jgi:hypothetical protein
VYIKVFNMIRHTVIIPISFKYSIHYKG